ncbi:LOW QUALITY PROTEIN: protein GREB1 [Mastacembelus armatus]|uniref:LOW QUALITY PROTEIN: protein GREB1 n=1 Tax=Mastacembelus armatus TaxID=205130 RepID=UPI000E457394|nr:LOW QUALITY PROTEIN: protein GREB1-like [Mastacembelus armatus]
MGNSYAGQLRNARFEEVLHNSIEASLRSNTVVPRPVFSQLYLDTEHPLAQGSRLYECINTLASHLYSIEYVSGSVSVSSDRTENEDGDDEDGSESNSPPIPYQLKPPPEGCCTADGFCQAGRDVRLSSLALDPLDVPPGFTLVGVKSPSLPETMLVCAVDRRFLPDERGHNALLGFSGNCMGCGEKGFCYFTEFSNHINLKLSTQPKKQNHLKYHLYRNNQGVLVKGAPICWRGQEGRMRQIGSSPSVGHLTSDEQNLPSHTPGIYTAESHVEPIGLPQIADITHSLTNGTPAVPSSQPLLNQSGPGRPTVTGPHANAGPPKKRHKGWSPESPANTLPENVVKSPPSSSAISVLSLSSGMASGSKSETAAVLITSQGSSTPLSPPGLSVTVPDQLLQTCSLQPVIFKGHGVLPQLTGSVSEVLVSSLLQTCYMSSQTLPRVYQHYGPSPIQPLSAEMQILLTVYYLVQLGPDQVPLIEDLEQIFMRSWRESHLSEIRQYQQPQTPATQGKHYNIETSSTLPGLPQHLSLPPHSQQPVTPGQLPWLAQLAASSCGEGVVVLGEQMGSLAQGLQQTFRRLMEGQLKNTNYVVIIVTGPGQETQSCVVVTGKHQCRALGESMFSPSEGLKEINHQLSTGVAQELINYCNSLGQDGDLDSLLDSATVDSNEPSHLSSSQESAEYTRLKNTHSPKDTYSLKNSQTSCVKDSPSLKERASSPKDTCSEYSIEWHEVRPIQLAVARKLLSHVCAIADSSTQNLDLGSFDRVSFLILVPPSEVTFHQTVLHLWTSGVLQELGGLDQECVSQQEAERYVVRMDQSAQARIDTLIQEAHSNSYTLYILVHDHAHWDISSASYSSSDTGLGLVDQLLNSRQVSDTQNILILHVTSFPFVLQTQYTRISPYNEIHWPSAFSNDVDLYHERMRYFGVSELLESTRAGSTLPLMRYDSSFESMASALEERFPKLHSAVIRTTVLIQHYCVALMAASGRISGSHDLDKHTSLETLETVQSLLTAAQQCPAHHGHMVLLRIPSLSLAAWAHRRLSRVRRQLGLEENFEIILGNPSQPLHIGQTFTEQIKTWLKILDDDWVPRTYLELDALPCILILSGAEPLGESLPRSLKYCDLRVISCSYLQRTTIEQELGLAAYLVKAESRPPDNPSAGSDLLGSDAEKLSSTDNEEEEGQENGDSPVSTIQQPLSCQDSGTLEPIATRSTTSPNLQKGSMDSIQSPSQLQTQLQPQTPSHSLPYPTPQHQMHTQVQRYSQAQYMAQLQPQTQVQSPNGLLSQSNSQPYVQTFPQYQFLSQIQTLHPQPLPPVHSGRQHSKSTSSGSLSPQASSPYRSCSWARGVIRPPSVLLPRALYDIITASDSSGLSRCTSFLPHMSVAWASSFRPLLSKMMTCTEQSLYYRQWTVPRACHMDSSNCTEGRGDNFHPRRLLLSGPPQVGKTGAYLHFLGILSRMLIRLMEVDIYDEEDINCSDPVEGVQYHHPNTPWPNPDIMRTMPFDYTIHDPKYDDISIVYCPGYKPSAEGNLVQQEDVYLRRRTSRIKLSKYAAYNTYHHCEQCHQYLGINPRYQVYESTLHAFTFTHLLLGEEIQLYFIIPKSKEQYFSFSQSGGQLESMRLPLTSDRSPDCIKSPIFTPTTGRHEHGLFNLYHAMEGASHLHILVVKEYEMAVYKKYWPNHIMLVLPTVFNGAGIGAAHFLIKELSYHNLELERSRQLEGGGQPGEVWPFIILADDSCVMWNTVDLDARNGPAEHAVSLKRVLQHMEACPDLTHYGLCGIRKWSSCGLAAGNRQREPFSRGHLHDFLLLNVDRSQNIQYDQNRFTCHDVDFTLRIHSAGLLICRFNNFSVMKKQIAIGGYRTFIIKTKMTDVPTSVGPSQYICAPDSKHLFLATPAQLLLEKYLRHTSHKLFPLSIKNYTHPVLSVDCYLNLGPEVTVCFVSSRPHSINISTTGLLFSGLLLCFTDSFVTPGFLKKFTFLKGATLCVISADRSSLRQTVGRLELEEEWRFRLSDEFQTANAKEDRPLVFLTGKHI